MLNSRKAVILVCVALIVGLVFYFGLQQFLTLYILKANLQSFKNYYAEHSTTMVAAFMLIYIFQTAMSLPGASILSIAAGAIFGPIMGTVYAINAATIGATLAFLLTRYLLRDIVVKKFGSKLEGINRELEERGINYLLFLRFVPLFPFFLINLSAGLTRLPLRSFFLATMFGIIPAGFVYVNAGASLASIDTISAIMSPRVLASFALLGFFALLPALYNRFKQRK